MKIIWFDLNSSYSHSNLGFPAMEAQLSARQREKIEWIKVSAVKKSVKEDILEELISYKADVFMATAWLFNHNLLSEFIGDLKAIQPNLKIILGGPEFLGTYNENKAYLESHRSVDLIFRGDGEEIFPKLIDVLLEEYAEKITNDRVLKAADFSKVKGVCGIDAETEEYFDEGLAEVKDFTILKVPESSKYFDWSKPFIQLETSRGCFNHCAFCVSGIGSSMMQYIPVNHLRKRLENIEAHGIKEIRVLDRTFNANPKRASELLSLFSEFIGKLRFHLEIHPAFLTDIIFDTIASYPLYFLHIEVGVQSLSDKVLKACYREGSCAKTEEGIKRLTDLKLYEIHADLIIGLPYYTYDMMLHDCIKLMKIGVQEIQIETLKCLPGTRMRNESKEFGFVYSPTVPYQVLSTKWMSFSDIRKAMSLSNLIDKWFNDGECRDFFRNTCFTHKSFMSDFNDYWFDHDLPDKLLSKESRWSHIYKFVCDKYPELKEEISMQWIIVGLSVKKEAGLVFSKWRKEGDIVNPFFKEDKPTYIYYYLLLKNKTVFWVVFDRSNSRNKPIEVQIIP
ncbi:MAG: DUF4080 domain-containing protein [Bacteroidales bacterium]